MSAPITVVTATIPGREDSLAETIRSVNEQTVPVECQLVYSHPITDEPGMLQYVNAKNALLLAVTTEWVAVLNDDDTWLPRHVEIVLPHLADADVVYTWDAGGTRPRRNCNTWSRKELTVALASGNFIDGNCLIRRSLLEEVGGFPADWVGGSPADGGHYKGSAANFEDWALWQRMVAMGARFRCVPVETWRYSTDGARLSIT